jgi:uncharacterized phage-associated protein
MENPIAVANFFIGKSLDSGIELTPMKLLKLVYISHGWYLAIKNEDLLSRAVEAWRYGPVVPPVYHKVKDYGDAQITSYVQEMAGLNRYYTPLVENTETKEFLEEVWDQYKIFNGLELSTLTHMIGTPWYVVFNDPKNKNKKGVIIPNDLIKQHYTEKLNANRSTKVAAYG